MRKLTIKSKSKENDNLYQVIYIAGGGHSGSTLLDMIIGTSPKVFGLGEVLFYNSYNYKLSDPKLYNVHKRKCSCNSEFEKCSFWNKVNKIAPRKLNVGKEYSVVDTLKTIWNIICPWQKFRFSLKTGDDKIFFDSVYKSINNQEVQYLLDSSKDPRRLLQIEQGIGKKSLKVIFLVRDIRGYINSYNNPKKWRVQQAGLKPQNYIRAGIRWVAVNIAIATYIKIHKIDAIKINYESFSRNPDSVLNNLQNEWGIELSDHYLKDVRNTTYHNIHGNLVKFSKIKRINHDKSWDMQLQKWKKVMIHIFFGWANYWFVISETKSNK